MNAPLPADSATQSKYEVRFEWGREGLASIAPGAGLIIVVDVISFTTTVDLASEQGLEIAPFSGHGHILAAATEADAVLGGGRGGPGITLSPSSITASNIAALGDRKRVLLASLNGSRLAALAGCYGVPVVAASLRNRSAVARWALAAQAERGERLMVAVVAAGESRHDGSLRFAVEDHLAAGAVIDALAEVGIDYCSPEAAAASAAFVGLKRATAHLLTASTSGQELIGAGQRDDVELAGQIDVSTSVPVLIDGVFRAA